MQHTVIPPSLSATVLGTLSDLRILLTHIFPDLMGQRSLGNLVHELLALPPRQVAGLCVINPVATSAPQHANSKKISAQLHVVHLILTQDNRIA